VWGEDYDLCVVHSSLEELLKEIKDWKYKDPDKIDEMPEESRDFHTVGQMFRIGLVQSSSPRKRQPKVKKHDDPT